jgi:prepilin-type N-terminal cleavage/methylation domain-containing protein
MTRQSAYVFSKWLKCPVVGEYVKEVQIFADNAREARSMAKNLFKEIQEKDNPKKVGHPRSAFTIVELLVVLSVIAIMIALIYSAIRDNSGSTQQNQNQITNVGIYQCVKTYIVVERSDSSKRIDLRSKNGSIDTMKCDDNPWTNQLDSDSVFAQFENGKWFSVKSTGVRTKGRNPDFPNVIEVEPVEEINAEKE